jgi:hypothetical protein
VNTGIEDYNLLMDGNKSLLAERDEFYYYCKDLSAELAEAHYDAEKRTATLELKVKSIEAHIIDVVVPCER